jgi:hypothetical protein
MPRRHHEDPRPGASAPGLRALLAGAVVLACVWAASAAGSADLPSYRIFLTDGTALVSFGEFARANGKVVFTVPIGSPSSPDALRIVTLPDNFVDWERTNRYTDAVRLQWYASTRGERDYTVLTAAVARALGDMAFVTDPGAKLGIGAEIRRQLIEWPSSHLGYRASDVRELTAIVEEAISDIRVGSGQRAFDLSLVAILEPPAERLLPEPTLMDGIDLASAIAQMTAARRERTSLQRSILSVLDRRKPSLPKSWYSSTRRALTWSLEREAKLDRQYAEIATRALGSATKYAARGDVASLDHLTADVRREDDRLGRQRPENVETLLASLAARTQTARAVRLAIDRWEYRTSAYATYRRRIDASLDRFGGVVDDIAAVRALSGIEPARLSKTDKRISAIEVGLLPLGPPAELRPAHDMLVSATRLMREAVRLQRRAALSGEMPVAQNASAAAAGGLLLLEIARTRIDEFFRRPVLP